MNNSPDRFDLSATFELAPMSLWLEDFSGVAEIFRKWRAEGVTDIETFLRADPARVAACAHSIRVLRVNARTVEMFEAESEAHLIANLDQVFRDDMLDSHVLELAELWSGKSKFCSSAINYTLSGRRLDIQLNAVVLPGHEDDLAQVLLTLEDVTAREDARRAAETSRAYAEGVFENSPVSLWVEDFSRIREKLEDMRMRGISDLRTFIDVHSEFVLQCMSAIRVLDVNNATLSLFKARDKQHLLSNLSSVFRDGMEYHFREQLIDLFNGNTFHSREVVNYALDGTERHLIMQFSVLPGYEDDWSRVLVALTDISARKKAEAYLEYLGKHDVLTGLHNRSFFADELHRIERLRVYPTSVIVLDLNGLKEANDKRGHDAGDQLLRRAGEVLKEATAGSGKAARIGGDEFAILMPNAKEEDARALVESIEKLITLNNRFYSEQELSSSIGWATRLDEEPMETLVQRADMKMYETKRVFYAGKERNRRLDAATATGPENG
ncbi:diguanylate cyclase [Pseudooceanicola sediminis]|uniref:Diguanylate cyclase n=1 Tax=Pseudooceanicola sediminis TaxID=2211117 RepID=A0A399J0B8_9RHOB|nr:GGDEF domain-containing protein [Pseudooceanicola sediminis]KAA2312088.1 sensor domain-containing diguanylate cyclase [Puniceibacterium sp. HSS470]RII38097.1 diguanylate cyclase [Pseudooceanicola sediminis]|tara:strand:+ start:32199 stop:33689 length:1491 start_codon:yes stop_codon:yes gene_type:complete